MRQASTSVSSPMSFFKAYIHFVWGTKNRYPYLETPELRMKLWVHIKENALSKRIFVDTVNGYTDHCHCLISLGAEQNAATIMQLIKGESAYWINKNRLCKRNFQWQSEYLGMAVSESGIARVREYILSQEAHHASRTFQDEYSRLFDVHGFAAEQGTRTSRG
jgi:putative transposase